MIFPISQIKESATYYKLPLTKEEVKRIKINNFERSSYKPSTRTQNITKQIELHSGEIKMRPTLLKKISAASFPRCKELSITESPRKAFVSIFQRSKYKLKANKKNNAQRRVGRIPIYIDDHTYYYDCRDNHKERMER